MDKKKFQESYNRVTMTLYTVSLFLFSAATGAVCAKRLHGMITSSIEKKESK